MAARNDKVNAVFWRPERGPVMGRTGTAGVGREMFICSAEITFTGGKRYFKSKFVSDKPHSWRC